MTTYYETNMEYISEELKRIDLMIYQQIPRIRQKSEDADEFWGLYISEEEIDAILYAYPCIDDEDQHIQTLIERIAELEQEIEEKKIDLRRMHLF
jgi:iron uptake system EfeUOB component EfeO/EfeM